MEQGELGTFKEGLFGLNVAALVAGFFLGTYVTTGDHANLAMAIVFGVAQIVCSGAIYIEYKSSRGSQPDQPPKTGGGSN